MTTPKPICQDCYEQVRAILKDDALSLRAAKWALRAATDDSGDVEESDEMLAMEAIDAFAREIGAALAARLTGV